VAVRASDGPRAIVVNASSSAGLVVDLARDTSARILSIVDHQGRPVAGHPQYLEPGLTRLQVPRSGLVEISAA
jgi:hypothetical protein